VIFHSFEATHLQTSPG